jgi:tetratricopeptide (TPR) repeat protein
MRLGEVGLAAWKRLDSQAARGLYERAVSLAPAGTLRRLRLECDLGVALKNVGRADDALELLDGVIRAAESLGEPEIALRARIEQAIPNVLAGAMSGGDLVALVVASIPLLETAGDDLALARAWHMVAAVEGGMLARADRSATAAERALGHYARAGFPSSAAAQLVAQAARDGPQPVPQCIELCRRLIIEESGELGAAPYIRCALAYLHALSGETEPARSELELSNRGLAELGDQSGLYGPWTLAAARVELLAGRLDAAEAVLSDACESLRALSERAWLATQASQLADVLLRSDRPDEAAGLVDEAAELALVDDLVPQTSWRRVRAKLLAASGSPDEGEQLAREAVALLDGSDHLCLRGETLLDLAHVLSTGGRGPPSREAAMSALVLFEAKQASVLALRARLAADPLTIVGTA